MNIAKRFGGLVRSITDRKDYAPQRQSRGDPITVRLKLQDRCALFDAGPASFSLRIVEGEWQPPATADYAAFALGALSMSTRLRFRLDAPVSNHGAAQVEWLANAYRLWSIKKLAPMAIETPHRVAASNGTGPGIVCLSGGIDSTYAAVELSRAGRSFEGLLLAGADYPDAEHKGFRELRGRAKKVADGLGVKLNIVESDIRRAGLKWNLLHGFYLATALHFMSAGRAFGAYALDHAFYQEVFQHPWGNNSILPPFFSTDHFPISGIGGPLRRVEKLQAIHAHAPELTDHLSVCYGDTETGHNCGRCVKCTNTRLTYLAAGISDQKAFLNTSPLLDIIDTYDIPENLPDFRATLVRVCELGDLLPEGAVKARLAEYERAVREAYCRISPD